MKMKIDQLLERMRIEYEDAIGEVIEPRSRLRDKVEIRSALVNAARPYATLRQLADMVGKADHSTIVHARKQHEVYHSSSPFYRFNYSMALKVVESFARKHTMVQRVALDSSVHCIHTEIQTMNRTINQLVQRRDNLKNTLAEFGTKPETS
jgi:hypothetical protein